MLETFLSFVQRVFLFLTVCRESQVCFTMNMLFEETRYLSVALMTHTFVEHESTAVVLSITRVSVPYFITSNRLTSAEPVSLSFIYRRDVCQTALKHTEALIFLKSDTKFQLLRLFCFSFLHPRGAVKVKKRQVCVI